MRHLWLCLFDAFERAVQHRIENLLGTITTDFALAALTAECQQVLRHAVL